MQPLATALHLNRASTKHEKVGISRVKNYAKGVDNLCRLSTFPRLSWFNIQKRLGNVKRARKDGFCRTIIMLLAICNGSSSRGTVVLVSLTLANFAFVPLLLHGCKDKEFARPMSFPPSFVQNDCKSQMGFVTRGDYFHWRGVRIVAT